MIKIGIFFGGKSREREVSFAGGRTVYDNLNKSLFEAVPIFVDSFGNFVLLDWQYIYKGSIRDFYPSVKSIQNSELPIQIYAESLGELSALEQEDLINEIGRKVEITELPSLIDFAFLALHGNYGEDGSIQGLFEYLSIPYSGSGILPSAIGMNKSFQKEIFQNKTFGNTRFHSIKKEDWLEENKKEIYDLIKEQVKIPLVCRPANQGSSIGVGMLWEDDFSLFCEMCDAAFFTEKITFEFWKNLEDAAKIDWLKEICDLRSNIGLPLKIQQKTIYTPEDLLAYLENYFASNATSNKSDLNLNALDSETEVLVEEFIDGEEFSCIVIKNENGKTVALPPTGIVKGQEIFDYRSKYLPGLSRKVTPIDLPNDQINAIQKSCCELYDYMRFDVYARIDGFIKKDGRIILNDPNTTSGMLPSSFFFHQAAEIGLNPSQFLTFLIRNSIAERQQSIFANTNNDRLLTKLDDDIQQFNTGGHQKLKVAVILGGYSTERHISVESGRNVYEKLASSAKYEPIPIFLTGSSEDIQLYQIPINLLLKDNADDIADKVKNFKLHPVVEDVKEQCQILTEKYGNASTAILKPIKVELDDLASMVDFAFIALHGRPGEDGHLQSTFDKYQLPYNGSSVESSQITIDKYHTNQLLKENGFEISKQKLVYKKDWQNDAEKFYTDLLKEFDFPFIAKPVDDGCSSAVKLIKNKEQLNAFTHLIFRVEEELQENFANILNLRPKEAFPNKQVYLVENFTQKQNADHFLEVTGGLLTKLDGDQLIYEMFEPSEALSNTEILSLEEKFLAGEGQNITPARYSKDPKLAKNISKKVQESLNQAAKLLKIEGYARIDAFVRIFDTEKVETIVIEANSLPGMTPATAIFHQAALNGYKPYEFIDAIIEYGIKKHSVK